MFEHEEEINLHAIDEDLLRDRIEDLEICDDLGEEYEVLLWIRDMLYLEREGFIVATEDGRYYAADVRCPNTP